MWTIGESKQVQKILPKLPVQVREKYELWKNIVRVSGPDALRLISGFNDEALSGQWDGYRSSRLSLQYRVIYFVRRDALHVDVERISAHDHKK